MKWKIKEEQSLYFRSISGALDCIRPTIHYWYLLDLLGLMEKLVEKCTVIQIILTRENLPRKLALNSR